MSKYKAHVGIQTIASTTLGEVEFNTIEEYYEKAEELWESLGYNHPDVNVSNDFDLGDWDISKIGENDLKYMLNKEE